MGECIPTDELTLSHFREHPIWLASHIHDYGDPRYENEDEEAMRPWDGEYPAPPTFSGDVLAECETASGLKLSGLLTVWNSQEESKAPIMEYEPRVWLPNGDQIPFWHGAVYQFGDKWLTAAKTNFYAEWSLDRDSAFPLSFTIGPDLLQEPIAITIPGFGYLKSASTVVYDV